MTDVFLARQGSARRQRGRRVVAGLFFFPRGGSAQVARALSHALAQTGWEVTLAAGSLGPAGEQTHAPTFFGAVDLVTVGYSLNRRGGEGGVPFQPSYEDRPGAPDRVFATVDDDAYERLVDVWADALDRAGAARAEVLHLHHLTPANEAALRAFPTVPVVGQLHGTELALLRAIEAGATFRLAVRGALAAAHAQVGARLRAADRSARRERRDRTPPRAPARGDGRAPERCRARPVPALAARPQ